MIEDKLVRPLAVYAFDYLLSLPFDTCVAFVSKIFWSDYKYMRIESSF